MAARSWIDLVGYQHEAVHDGALKELLDTPVAGPAIAAALLNRPIDGVAGAQKQAKVGRAVADLRVRVDDRGKEAVVGIETKVDSAMSISQLERTAHDGDEVALLCLGTSAMQTCTVVPAYPGEHDWPITTLARWSEVLREMDVPPLLIPYREAVEVEAAEHADARAIARGELDGDDFAPRNPDLPAWAWLDETWLELCRLDGPGRIKAHKDISGPIFFWEDSWVDFTGSAGGLYLDLMGSRGRRQIVLKASGVERDDRSKLHEAIRAMKLAGATPPARRSFSSDTFTLLFWDVTEQKASESAVLALEVRDAAQRAAAEL